MHAAERMAEKDSISKIERYKKEEKHTLRRLRLARNAASEQAQTVDYSSYQSHLQELIVELKGALLDIEVALQQSLENARNGFFSNVKSIND